MLVLIILLSSYMGFTQITCVPVSGSKSGEQNCYTDSNKPNCQKGVDGYEYCIDAEDPYQNSVRLSINYEKCSPDRFMGCVRLADKILQNRYDDKYVEAGIIELNKQCKIFTAHARDQFDRTYLRLFSQFQTRYIECANESRNSDKIFETRIQFKDQNQSMVPFTNSFTDKYEHR